MNISILNDFINEVSDKFKNGESKPDVKSYLESKRVSIYDIDKIFREANRKILAEFSDNAIKLIHNKSSKEDVYQFIAKDLPEELARSVLNEVISKYKSQTKAQVFKVVTLTNDYSDLIKSVANEFISETEVKEWIVYYFSTIQKRQKSKRKNEVVAGVALIMLGLIITLGTYYFAVLSGGGKYLMSYGPIIAGLIAIGKGMTTDIVEVPEL